MICRLGEAWKQRLGPGLEMKVAKGRLASACFENRESHCFGIEKDIRLQTEAATTTSTQPTVLECNSRPTHSTNPPVTPCSLRSNRTSTRIKRVRFSVPLIASAYQQEVWEGNQSVFWRLGLAQAIVLLACPLCYQYLSGSHQSCLFCYSL